MLRESQNFWKDIERDLGAQTIVAYLDPYVDVRVVNDSRVLKLVMLSLPGEPSRLGFDWYVMVAGGASVTATKFVLSKNSVNPHVISSTDDSGNGFAIVTENIGKRSMKGHPLSYDPPVLEMLIKRVKTTFTRAVGWT